MASYGTAESFLTASSIIRTRQEHQITACSLHNLMKKAYQDYCTDGPASPPLGLEDWCVHRRRASPQFRFWNQMLDMELAIFTLFRSFREGNIKMWKVGWTKLPPIASSCQELTKCSCKKGCTVRRKCLRSELACTAFCNCACQQYNCKENNGFPIGAIHV